MRYLIAALSVCAITAAAHADDRVSRLARSIDSGSESLEYRNHNGYLKSLLEKLRLSPDSQLLVFSKTSFQAPLISPSNPRAIYFGDDVALGYVPGGKYFELTALDAHEGVVFYTLNTEKSAKPVFERRSGECLNCHASVNRFSPGLMVTSVLPSPGGAPFYTGNPFEMTDDRTPVEDRWGGWFVHGSYGSPTPRHRGNAVAVDPLRPAELTPIRSAGFNAANYATTSSDVVALLTLEHQVRLTNMISGISRQAEALHNQNPAPAAIASYDAALEDLAAYMLSADAATIPGPVKGPSRFREEFESQGPRDGKGRSLRDFDLVTRLFRYPLSWMISTEIFEAMEPRTKDRLLHRIYDVLSGTDTSARYSGISAERRRAALEISTETVPGLPAWWPGGLKSPAPETRSGGVSRSDGRK